MSEDKKCPQSYPWECSECQRKQGITVPCSGREEKDMTKTEALREALYNREVLKHHGEPTPTNCASCNQEVDIIIHLCQEYGLMFVDSRCICTECLSSKSIIGINELDVE